MVAGESGDEGLKLPNKRVLSDVEDCRPRLSWTEAFEAIIGEELVEARLAFGEISRRALEEAKVGNAWSVKSASDIASCRSSASGS